MADYGKLKVVDLKEVLKERGLQVSGKKAELIARLEEDDATKQQEAPKDNDAPEEEAEEPTASQGTLKGAEAISRAESTAPEASEAGRVIEPEASISAGEIMDASTGGPAATDPQAETAFAPEPSMAETVSEEQVRAEAKIPLVAEEPVTVEAAAQEQEEKDTRPLDTAHPRSEPLLSQTSTIIGRSRHQTPEAKVLSAESTAPIPTFSEEEQISVQHIALPQDSQGVPIARDEVIEDTQKRKRRSQSPIPSGAEVATRKAKALDGSPRAVAVSAESGVSTPATSEPAQAHVDDASPAREGVMESTGKRKRRSQSPIPADVEVTTKKVKSSDEPSQTTAMAGLETQQVPDDEAEPKRDVAALQSQGPSIMEEETDRAIAASGEESELQHKTTDLANTESSWLPVSKSKAGEFEDKILSPTKQIPNAKFKGLFETTASGKTEAEATFADDDRDVEPALHPATTALYIRNFMRPLQPNQLQDHLESLARPPNDSSTDRELVHEFFLDNIKTHCLVQFHSISAASRVRLALHDRVWPDERTRKALWVDYIPEEKVHKWIEVERDNSRGSRGSQKRFEVVYEKENGEAVAYLQEADGAGGRSSLSGTGGGQRNGYTSTTTTGVRAAAPPAGPKAEVGKGFEQLDDLFRSTIAKPKLYFQPVSDSVADKRLDLLAAGRGGGRNDEMRRFTFEDTRIVHKGPEFGSGWRGGMRGRGGGSGGFGRGYGSRYDGHRGGYRGDSYR